MSKFSKDQYPPLLKKKRTKRESLFIEHTYTTLAHVINSDYTREDMLEMADAFKEAMVADGTIFFE